MRTCAPHLSHPKLRQCTPRCAAWVQVRFGGVVVVIVVCENSDSRSSKTVTVPSMYFDRTKDYLQRGSGSIGAKWWYCLRENALF